MTGVLTAPEYRINDANTKLIEGANNSVRVQTSYGYTEIGPQNTTAAHFITDRSAFYFNKPVLAESKLQVYATNTYLTGTEGKIAGNTVWHAGNDGSGSGLDADLLDGKHLDYILDNVGKSLVEIRTTLYADPGTYTWSPLPKTTYVVVQLWSGGGGGAAAVEPLDHLYFPVNGGNGGNSSFGSYFSAVGGRGGSGSTGGSAGYGSGGSTNISGKPGGTAYNYYGGVGGSLFIEGYNPEGGGGGSHDNTGMKGGGGGGSGGYAKKGFYINSISTPVQVVVGAGGARGVGSKGNGAAGRPGRVVISEYGIY